MRYLLLGVLLSGLGRAPALAQTAATEPEAAAFWSEAQRLTQQQRFALSDVEAAIASPDPESLRLVRGQVLLHLNAVDRFLVAQSPIPELICGPNGLAAGSAFPFASAPTPVQPDVSSFSSLDSDQVSVYCALLAAKLRLEALSPQLEQRQLRLAGGQPPATAAATEPPETATLDAAAEIGAPLPAVIGRPAKLPIADALPLPPAIAAPDSLSTSLQMARQFLVRAEAAFPPDVLIDPAAIAQLTARSAYGVSAQDLTDHASFLAQTGTGIARVLPIEIYRSISSPTNRVAPTLAEQFPFAPLVAGRADGFVPRFAVQVIDGSFAIAPAELDYGFMQDIGDVALEALPSGAAIAQSDLIPEPFVSYQPPPQLAALQLDRRQFATGKVELPLDQPLSSQAPVAVGHTYLLRSLQFSLPEVVTSRRPITRRERRQLAQLLETQSSDLLIAFRPVAAHPDNSYTVLWRILAVYPDPAIADLDRYVRY